MVFPFKKNFCLVQHYADSLTVLLIMFRLQYEEQASWKKIIKVERFLFSARQWEIKLYNCRQLPNGISECYKSRVERKTSATQMVVFPQT